MKDSTAKETKKLDLHPEKKMTLLVKLSGRWKEQMQEVYLYCAVDNELMKVFNVSLAAIGFAASFSLKNPHLLSWSNSWFFIKVGVYYACF